MKTLAILFAFMVLTAWCAGRAIDSAADSMKRGQYARGVR